MAVEKPENGSTKRSPAVRFSLHFSGVELVPCLASRPLQPRCLRGGKYPLGATTRISLWRSSPMASSFSGMRTRVL